MVRKHPGGLVDLVEGTEWAKPSLGWQALVGAGAHDGQRQAKRVWFAQPGEGSDRTLLLSTAT